MSGNDKRFCMTGWKAVTLYCDSRYIRRIVDYIHLPVNHGKSQFHFIFLSAETDTAGFVHFPFFTGKKGICHCFSRQHTDIVVVCLVHLKRRFSVQCTVGDVQITFFHPYPVEPVQFIQGFWLCQLCFPQKRIHCLVIPFLFPFCFRIIRFCIKQTYSQFSAGTFHPVCTELHSVIKKYGVGGSEFQ